MMVAVAVTAAVVGTTKDRTVGEPEMVVVYEVSLVVIVPACGHQDGIVKDDDLGPGQIDDGVHQVHDAITSDVQAAGSVQFVDGTENVGPGPQPAVVPKYSQLESYVSGTVSPLGPCRSPSSPLPVHSHEEEGTVTAGHHVSLVVEISDGMSENVALGNHQVEASRMVWMSVTTVSCVQVTSCQERGGAQPMESPNWKIGGEKRVGDECQRAELRTGIKRLERGQDYIPTTSPPGIYQAPSHHLYHSSSRPNRCRPG